MLVMKSILVVDDDEDDCTIIRDSLYQVGARYPIYTVHGGVQAFRMLDDMSGNLPALIILDLNMPRMNGLDVLAKLKSAHQIPVILYTTSCTEETTTKAKNLGAIDCIKKGNSYTDNLKFAKYVSGLLKDFN